MLRINPRLRVEDLDSQLQALWQLSGQKGRSLADRYDLSAGAPVFTVQGKYTSRAWTDWTLGFYYGSNLLQFEATGEPDFLETGRTGTLRRMSGHVTHMGVHDHGFNIVSTFGNLRRMIREGAVNDKGGELEQCELALRCSAAVQARRWTPLPDGGFIYSFNGPHSLFVDTLRSLRSLALGHYLGHELHEEGDRRVSLLERLVQHARTTARFAVFYGEGRDIYDVRGRVAHESIFNVADGAYRCPNTQQGYSPWTTWTRGLAWALLGFAEELEYIEQLPPEKLSAADGEEVRGLMLRACRAAADYYIESTPANGVPYWDTGAPGLVHLGDYLERPADPFNDYEPVDSSAAVIATQGLLRLGRYLERSGERDGATYRQAGLTVAATVLEDPFISRDPEHEGLILHSVYHRPNGWDYVPTGRNVPCGESSQWGDYHARELALYLGRWMKGQPDLCFWK